MHGGEAAVKLAAMESVALQRSVYVPITNRRRVTTLALVAALYALAVIAILGVREAIVHPVARDAPLKVILFPLDTPPKPLPPRAQEKPRARSQQPPAPAPAVARAVSPPPVPTLGHLPAPSAQPAPPKAITPPGPPTPIIAGEGDAVYDLDAGGGGTPGFVPPRWIRKVTNDEFFPLVDEELMRQSFEVDYRMQCVISLSTRVSCRVLREVPFYPGLRRAVLAAVPILRMAPGRRDGRPIDGQRVEFLWRITVERGDVTIR